MDVQNQNQDIINEPPPLKRLRDDLRKEQTNFPSHSKEARKISNKKQKLTTNRLRGRLEYYYKAENEKIELLNKMDKLKLFLGEGKLNVVSTFELLHRVFDYFINQNIPSERGRNQNPTDEGGSMYMYQEIQKDEAKSEQLYVGSRTSLQTLISQVESHSSRCPKSLQIKSTKMLRHVISMDMECNDSEHAFSWTSSPHMKNGKFLVNARLAHGYFTSGILPNQFGKFCEASNIGDMGEKYLKEFQKAYEEVVSSETKKCKENALQEEIASTAAMLPDGENITGINILTDARHCWRKNAAFSDVVCLGHATCKVLDIQTVSKKEDDPCSQRHELIGVKRIYSNLDEQSCPVNIHAHDNNNQINKYIQEERSPTENALDSWHMTKSIAKAAKKITSGQKATHGKIWHEELSDKAASIRTHVYHSMKNCQNNADVLRNNLLNFIDHYKGDHENCLLTSRCKTDQNYECSKYIIKTEMAEKVLTDFLKGLQVYKNAEKYKFCMDTHYVESFNNALLQYVDKRISFGSSTYKMRINLALLDWNENVNRSSTSEKTVSYKRNPERTYTVPIKKRKTNNFKEEIWVMWINKLYDC